MSYSQKELHNVYEEIALERPHICTGCGTSNHLSHSHLIPRSRSSNFVTNKLNIAYHCMSIGEKQGCHSIWDSMDCVTLQDFEVNFRIIHDLDREYFWMRMLKLDAHHRYRKEENWKKVRALLVEMEKKESAGKVLNQF